MAAYIFHSLIMGKVETGNFYCLIGDNRILFLQQCLLNSSQHFNSKKWLNMLKIDFLGCHGNGQVVMNTYRLNLRIKMFCISIFTKLLLKNIRLC